ncbi:MAG: tRNA (adenosine(37)-N6)-dimethylallyltransferase MiaA, partial [Gammaproteobacteria bacterium RIFCSPHIGHO2_12_FULL_45_9]
IYRGLDIGTAKPTQAERARVPHHLIDILEPTASYAGGQFCADARVILADITARGKIPLLVGGTLLYFHLLRRGFSDFPGTDLAARQCIEAEAAQVGWVALHHKLQQIDPLSARTIHAHDAQRISRALEIYDSTGRTLSDWKKNQQWEPLPYTWHWGIVLPDRRAILHERIAARFHQMIAQGFLDEVAMLRASAELMSAPFWRMVGYSQARDYFEQHQTLQQLEETMCAATRQLAKRQITWLQQWPDIPRWTLEAKEWAKWVTM